MLDVSPLTVKTICQRNVKSNSFNLNKLLAADFFHKINLCTYIRIYIHHWNEPEMIWKHIPHKSVKKI